MDCFLSDSSLASSNLTWPTLYLKSAPDFYTYVPTYLFTFDFKFSWRPNSPTKKDDTIEVHLNQDDVQVTLTDEHGNPLPLKDVDLQLKLPAKCKDTSFKGTLKQFVKKLKKSPQDNDITYTVKEKVKLTDHATGQSFDVEMNLKVKLPADTTTKNGHRQHQVKIIFFSN